MGNGKRELRHCPLRKPFTYGCKKAAKNATSLEITPEDGYSWVECGSNSEISTACMTQSPRYTILVLRGYLGRIFLGSLVTNQGSDDENICKPQLKFESWIT